MLKIYIVALMLASSCEIGSSTFLAALKTLLIPPNTQQSAAPALPPYPTYKAFVDPNPPRPPIRPNYVPKPFPDYKVSFASPGMGIGTNGFQLTYANHPSAIQYSSANNIINPQVMQYPSANYNINPSAMQYSPANTYVNPSAMQYLSAVNPPSLHYSSGLPNAPAIPDQVYYSNKPSSDYSQINSQTLTSQFDIAVPAGSTIDFHLPAQFHSAVLNQDSKNIPIPVGASFGQAHVSSGIEVGHNSDSNAQLGQTDQEAIRQLPQPAKLESSSETALKISTDDEDKNALNVDIHPEELQKALNQPGTPSFSMDALTKDFRLVFVTNQNESQDNTEAQSPRSIFNANQAVENQGLPRYVNSGPSQGHKVNLGPFYTPQPAILNEPVVKATPPAPAPIPDPPKIETVPPVTEETRVVGEVVEDSAAIEPERTPLEADAALSAPERTPVVADAPLSAGSSGGFGNFFPGGFNNLPGLLSSAMGNARNPGGQGQGFSPQNQGFSPQSQGFSPQSQGFSPQNQGFAPNVQDSSMAFDTPNSFQGAYYSPQQFQPYGQMYYQPAYSYGDVGSAMYVPTVMQADDYGQPEELETMTVLLDPSNEMNTASNQYGSSSGGHRPSYNSYVGSNDGRNHNMNFGNSGVSSPDNSNYRNPGVSKPDNSNYRHPAVSQPDDSNYRRPGVSQQDDSNYRHPGVSQPNDSNYRRPGVNRPDDSNYRHPGVSQPDDSNYRRPGVNQPDDSNYRQSGVSKPDDSNYRNNVVRQLVNSNYGNTGEHQPDNSNFRGPEEHQPDNQNYGNTGTHQPDNLNYRDTEASQQDNANFHNSYVNHQDNYVPVHPTTNNEYQHGPFYNSPKNTADSNFYSNQDGIHQPNRPVIYVDQQNSFVAANDDRQTVSTYIEDIEKIPNYYQPPVADQIPKVYDSSYPAIPKPGFNSMPENQPQSEYHHSNAQTSDKFDHIGSQMEEFELLTVEPKYYSSTSAPEPEIIEIASSHPIHSMELNPYGPNEHDQSFSHQYENEAPHKNSENTDFVVRAPVYSPDTNTDYEYKPVLLVGPFYRPNEPEQQLPTNYQSAVTENVEQNMVSDKQANDFIGGRVYPADDEEEKTSQDDDDSVDSQYHSSYIHMESASPYPVYGNAITPHTILKNEDASSSNEYKPIALIGPFGGYNTLRGKSLDSQQSELVGDYDTIQASSIAPFPKRTPMIRKKPTTDGGVSISRVHTQFSTSDFQEKWRNDPPYFEHTSPSEHFDQSTPFTEDKGELLPEQHHFEAAEVQPNDDEYNPILVAGPFLEPPTDEDIQNNEKVESVQEEYVPVLVAGPLTNEEDAQNLVGDAISDHAANENDEEDDSLLLPPNRDSDAEYKPLLVAGQFQPKGDDGSTLSEALSTSTERPPVPPKAYDRWRTPSPRRKFTINSKRKMNEFYPTTYHPVSADGDDSLSNDVVTDTPIETASSSNVEHLSDEGVYGMKIHPKLIVKTV